MELALKITFMCHQVKIAITYCQALLNALNICTSMGVFQHTESKNCDTICSLMTTLDKHALSQRSDLKKCEYGLNKGNHFYRWLKSKQTLPQISLFLFIFIIWAYTYLFFFSR